MKCNSLVGEETRQDWEGLITKALLYANWSYREYVMLSSSGRTSKVEGCVFVQERSSGWTLLCRKQ